MADTKITALTEDTDPQPADLLATVDDPSGSPITKKATITNVLKAVDNLTADTAPLAADLLMTIDDPGGTPAPKKSVISDVVGYIVTTAGDIMYATASRVLARLAIGTAGQVLTTNAGATAPEWAAVEIVKDVSPQLGANLDFNGNVFTGTAQTEITDELTTITHTAPGTPDYAVQDMGTAGGLWAWVDHDEANTTMSVIANNQARINDLEDRLVALGLIPDAD